MSAKSNVLKSLANKMYHMEMESYKNGETDQEPEPQKKEIKQTKKEEKQEKITKTDQNVKDMVKSFFHQKKDKDKASFTRAIKPKKQKLHIKNNNEAKTEIVRKPKKKKVII